MSNIKIGFSRQYVIHFALQTLGLTYQSDTLDHVLYMAADCTHCGQLLPVTPPFVNPELQEKPPCKMSIQKKSYPGSSQYKPNLVSPM